MLRITLITTGRKTGQPRSVSLYAFEDGDGLVVVGSYAGRPRNPAWVVNLRANPHAVLRRGREQRQVRAREIVDPERERLWELVSTEFPLYETYQRRTERLIPLFFLEPLGEA